MPFLNFSEHFVVGVPLYKIKNLHFVFDPPQIAPFSSLPCHAQLFKRLCSVYKKVKSILSYCLLGKNFVSRNLFHHKDFYPHVTLRKIQFSFFSLMMLWIKPGAACVLGQRSSEPHPQPHFFFYCFSTTLFFFLKKNPIFLLILWECHTVSAF